MMKYFVRVMTQWCFSRFLSSLVMTQMSVNRASVIKTAKLLLGCIPSSVTVPLLFVSNEDTVLEGASI